MRVFLDTSVVVAAFLADHEHHGASLEAFLDLPGEEHFCAAHSLAEVYSTVTRLASHHRVPPDHAALFIHEMRRHLSMVELAGRQYEAAITAAARDGIVGGAVDDALILQCARKIRAETILTWNLRDFRRLSSDLAHLIKTPG